jgi:hypothetical protein
VLPVRVSEDRERFEWTWTVVGERNWTEASVSRAGVTLRGSYPLNSRERARGTHVWEVSLTVEKRKDSGVPAEAVWKVQARGSDAAASAASGTLSLGPGTVDAAVQSLRSHPLTTGLPARIDLAALGQERVRLVIEK